MMSDLITENSKHGNFRCGRQGLAADTDTVKGQLQSPWNHQTTLETLEQHALQKGTVRTGFIQEVLQRILVDNHAKQ